jgi:hypothetical protein
VLHDTCFQTFPRDVGLIASRVVVISTHKVIRQIGGGVEQYSHTLLSLRMECVSVPMNILEVRENLSGVILLRSDKRQSITGDKKSVCRTAVGRKIIGFPVTRHFNREILRCFDFSYPLTCDPCRFTNTECSGSRNLK